MPAKIAIAAGSGIIYSSERIGIKSGPFPALVAHGTADANVLIEVVERLWVFSATTGPGAILGIGGMSHGFRSELGPETGRMVQTITEFTAKGVS